MGTVEGGKKTVAVSRIMNPGWVPQSSDRVESTGDPMLSARNMHGRKHQGESHDGRDDPERWGDQDDSVPKPVVPPNKTSGTCSVILLMIINLVAIHYVAGNRNVFTQDILMDAMNIGFTVVLAIVALAITVFRMDKEPSGRRDSDENAGRICLSYVFGVFPIIPILVLG